MAARALWLVCLPLLLAGCVASQPVAPLTPELQRLERLASDFYVRLGNRRVDSVATYRDPALREFFRSEKDFADYYAALVRELTEAHFDANRPTRIDIEALERLVGDDGEANGVRIDLRLYGKNGRPLRWWRSRLSRSDVWRTRSDGTWEITPGKI